MGFRTIKWKTRASRKNLDLLRWYRANMGEKAAMNYFNGIMDAVETLAQMPAIGRVDTKFSKGKTIYYSFVVHPKYRIVYRYTQRTLYIVAIRATMMK